jgi:hypothetical protein
MDWLSSDHVGTPNRHERNNGTATEERCFLRWSVHRGYKEDNWSNNKHSRVEAGSNTSTVALRVVGDEKGTQCLGV